MRPTKSASPSWQIDISAYQKAVDWVGERLLEKTGDKPHHVTHDPEPNLWRFYDDSNELIVNVPHALMERIFICLERKEWKRGDSLTPSDVEEWERVISEDPDPGDTTGGWGYKLNPE